MNWPAVFLGCFLVGFLLSVMSFALSAVHLQFHVHVPFADHLHFLPGHVGVARGAHGHGGVGDAVSPINFPTLMAFLAWFGGTGYLLTSQFRWLTVPSLVGATLSGIVGAAIVLFVMAKLLWSPDENMQSADYHMVGVLGRVGNPIREGGTGELIYSHGGTRHSCGARSADGRPVEKGAEVVVTAYDRGIAYVSRWEDLEKQA